MRTLKWTRIFIRTLKAVKKINIIFFTFVKDLTQSNHYKGTQEEQIVNQFRLNGEDGERCKKGNMNYTPQHIANYFLDKAEAESIPMTPLKLIKLVYIAYGWHIALTNKSLFSEEIQAWQHGPVITSLYHEFKHFEKSPITCRSEDIDFDTWEKIIPRINTEDDATNFTLDKVWKSYRRFRAWDLRNKTHEKGSPWDLVYKKGKKGISLKDDDIKSHYRKRISEYLHVAKSSISSRVKTTA